MDGRLQTSCRSHKRAVANWTCTLTGMSRPVSAKLRVLPTAASGSLQLAHTYNYACGLRDLFDAAWCDRNLSTRLFCSYSMNITPLLRRILDSRNVSPYESSSRSSLEDGDLSASHKAGRTRWRTWKISCTSGLGGPMAFFGNVDRLR